MNRLETEERIHLEKVQDILNKNLEKIDGNLSAHVQDIHDNKEYLWESRDEMDGAEKASVRQSIAVSVLTGESMAEKRERIAKLIETPYFGRIDFLEDGKRDTENIYIGVHSFYDEANHVTLIHDWRAPVSSMFYDFELGRAFYEAPQATISGTIDLKRQYRIRESKLEFMLESSLNIHDDVLQKELSSTSDEKMKNIVATIQRDQNQIIRNDTSRVLIIQGVAGSGKTSIALHRIAFLLYKHKETITSRNILIVSPNKVFADYISNVLPELGEEKILEVDCEKIASDQLGSKIKFQTFFEQVTELIDSTDSKFIQRIQYKSSFDFLSKLRSFFSYMESDLFSPQDVQIGAITIPAEMIREKFKSLQATPISKRFTPMAREIAKRISFTHKTNLKAADVNKLRTSIKKMFKTHTLISLYKEFYTWLGSPEMFKTRKGRVLEYSDVFPLTLLKIKFEGTTSFDYVKHLVVDEMQDYTPVQYAVLEELFRCRKTILGDANQSVNPYSSTTCNDIAKVFSKADIMKLCKSYRSSFEIATFAQKISQNEELEIIERHGEEPTVTKVKDDAEQIAEIKKLIKDFSASNLKSLGLICKSQHQAGKIYDSIKDEPETITILDAESSTFSNGVIITTAHMAKGLEFDQVIIPFSCSKNYHNEMDKSMLYISCTRAMHKLNLIHTGNKSPFLEMEHN
ncbi:AAA family ATPase [Chitinispirillales bacterium ANBcel5]|uniref:HelD family protein n=1 Tax=Cellulosispirillum alkaliphilum TaxID=3039283 RepID=UPI002A4EEDD1|nr:AAA family ATPase [Chitinispirillales bacterium ANBcel5]